MKHRTHRIRFLTPELRHDLIMIFLGAVVAYIFVRTPLFIDLLHVLAPIYPLAAFITGIFFTSALTIAPAAIMFAKIASTGPALSIALWGGLGAMIGDLIIFLFLRDHFAEHIKVAFRHTPLAKKFLNTFHLGFMKWLSPLLGALIIASPLPDEFGLALMGLSRVRLLVLMPISFAMNVLGIAGLISFVHLLG